LDGVVTIAIASAPAILIALKVTLDQLSGVLDSAAQTRDAWRRFRNRGSGTPQQDEGTEQAPPVDDEEPPVAA